MHQPVHGGRGHQWVGEYQRPLVEVAVAGDHRGVALIAVADHLIQILLLVLGQRGEPEIVQDKKSDGADLAQPALVGGIAATGMNPVEQHAGALIGDLISLATGDVPERLSCVALADAAWANQKDILRPLDEAAGSEFAQGRRVDARIEREIEGLQGLVRGTDRSW